MTNWIQTYLPNVILLKAEIITSLLETLYMVFWTGLLAGLLGIFFGVWLTVTAKNGILENLWSYNLIDKIINVLRSVPFVILLAVIAPLTRIIVGSSIGTTAALVPLIIGTVPFFARQIQTALASVSPGVIEAAISMGSSPLEIIFQVYLKEGLISIVRVSAVTIVNLIGLTTMAGAIGGGGLGNLAISRGYNRFQNDVTLVTTLLILILVFFSQWISNILIRKFSHGGVIN